MDSKVSLPFVNRVEELAELDRHARSGGLVVLYGRRRLGKSRLLREWVRRRGGVLVQAVEGSPGVQVAQAYQDLRSRLEAKVEPRNWEELLSLVSTLRGTIVCVDEFPYWVAADPSVPSRIQRWIDEGRGSRVLLALCGSSQRMMHDACLSETAPLYGRAKAILRVEPMGYADFCRALHLPMESERAFSLFSLVGGAPRYWELLDRRDSPSEAADRLYFRPSAILEDEPRRLLDDELIHGQVAKSLLEAVGRGAHRPSEAASRVGIPQTQLAKSLQLLVQNAILIRETPFGESERASKRGLYRIADPMLRFWYSVFSPHRSRWFDYGRREKELLVRAHAATVFEDRVRASFPGARRYWEGDLELDAVREEKGRLRVVEVKFGKLSPRERARAETQARASFERSRLAARYSRAQVEVVDTTWLAG